MVDIIENEFTVALFINKILTRQKRQRAIIEALAHHDCVFEVIMMNAVQNNSIPKHAFQMTWWHALGKWSVRSQAFARAPMRAQLIFIMWRSLAFLSAYKCDLQVNVANVIENKKLQHRKDRYLEYSSLDRRRSAYTDFDTYRLSSGSYSSDSSEQIPDRGRYSSCFYRRFKVWHTNITNYPSWFHWIKFQNKIISRYRLSRIFRADFYIIRNLIFNASYSRKQRGSGTHFCREVHCSTNVHPIQRQALSL